ncbi:MAG: hypothetical protein JWM41_1118 [Gemmatimonadetes bacterium]|nr:hypothetical protein [Gemmatimonadota bacterium]
MASTSTPGASGETPPTGLSLESLSKLAQAIGSLAVAGTVLGALAFGVGYLAVKQHDETLGVISTTSYALYVRTGVEFLPRTLQAMALFLGTSFVPVLILVLLVTAIAAARAFVPASTNAGPTTGTGTGTSTTMTTTTTTAPSRMSRVLEAWPLVRTLLVAVLLVGGVAMLSSQLAPLDSINTGLLLDTYHPEYERFGTEASEVYGLLHRPAVDSSRLKPGGGHTATATSQLFIKYGRKAFLTAMFVYLTALVSASKPATVPPPEPKPLLRSAPLRATQRKVLEPMLMLLCGVMVLSLPLLYGVLCIPTALPCVDLVTPSIKRQKDSELPARALSDLSGDIKEIVLFRWGDQAEGQAYTLERVGAQQVTQVNGTRCVEGNMLHEKVIAWRMTHSPDESLKPTVATKARRAASSVTPVVAQAQSPQVTTARPARGRP